MSSYRSEGFTIASKQAPTHAASFGSSPPMRSIYGSSPPAAFSVFGTSPPSGVSGAGQYMGSGAKSSEKQAPDAAAKKFWKRICFDPTLDPREFKVGYVDSVQQQVRQSGVGAWSMRVHDQLQEIPYETFLRKFSDDDIPFHRIAFFKHRSSIVWESDYFKKKAAEADAAVGAIAAAAVARPGRAGSCEAKAGALGASPDSSRRSSFLLVPPAVSGDLLGGSCDGDEDAEQLSADEWEQEDLVAGEMDPDGLPDQQGQGELQLPEQCWLAVLFHLAVRDVCTVARVNKWLHELCGRTELWQAQYTQLFGEQPQPSCNTATVRRMCRRSEIKAARWLEAEQQEQQVGFPNTTCLQLDDSKVVSGDGQAVRVWRQVTGRRYCRIATLPGHAGMVTSVAYDDNLLLSGCGQGMVKVWAMDDLKCMRTFRTAHNGSVAGVGLMNGIPVSAGADAYVRLWDVASGQPIMVLDSPRGQPVLGMEVQPQSSRIATCGDGVHMWDASTMVLLHDLGLPQEAHAAGGEEQALFKCVTSSASILAAGVGDQVMLWDQRCAALIGAVAAPLDAGSRPLASCAAVQLDDWKLMAAFNLGPAEGRLALYDMRALPALRAGPAAAPSSRLQPLQVLHTSGRIYSMKFHNLLLMAGMANQDCCLWTFNPPATAGSHLSGSSPLGPMPVPPVGSSGATGTSAGGAGPPSLDDAAGAEQGGSPPGPSLMGAAEDANRRRKGKPPKMVKKQNRYPKRSK